MTQIICLANSKKLSERCIAGINIETGKWVRPICKDYPEDGRVPRNIRLINGQEPKLLDFLDIPLDNKGEDFGFESENLNILPGQWKKTGRVSPQKLDQFIDNQLILHNCHKYVAITLLQALPFAQRKTIQLVYTQKLQITRNGNSWEGSINNDSSCRLNEAKITDPEFINKLESGYIPLNPCLVTVSLSMPYIPFEDWEGDPPCWKLIAGVIELS